jgi:hypothetical protein
MAWNLVGRSMVSIVPASGAIITLAAAGLGTIILAVTG